MRDFALLLLLPAIVLSIDREFASNATVLSGADSSIRSEGRAEARTEEATRNAERRSGPSTRSRDSYLEALRHSRTSTDPREGIVAADGQVGSALLQRRKEPIEGPAFAAKRSEISTDRDSFSVVRSDSFSLPSRTSGDFHGVRNSYGPPQPPRDTYGPAYNDYSSYGEYGNGGVYSIPQQQGYGSQAATYGTAAPYGHGVAHAMSESLHLGFPSIDFSWPFALKLNAFTLAKILLKLVIFKMIVKFIAIICLLLFIPKLEIKKGNKGTSMDSDEDDDERRSLDADSMVWDRLNLLTAMVNSALGSYETGNEPRTGPSRAREALDYENLLRGYLLEEARLLRATTST